MNKILKKIKRLIALTTIIALLLTQAIPVYAFEIPSAPSAPTAPSAPSLSSDPSPVPSSDSQQTGTEENTPPESDSYTALSDPDTITSPPSDLSSQIPSDTNNQTSNDSLTNETGLTGAPSQTGVSADGNAGDTSIRTGDATNSGISTTEVNTNITTSPLPLPETSLGDQGSISVINSDNGASSTNTGSASIITENNTIQTNNADVGNNLDLSTITGENSASKNVGNSSIQTGDANTSGTIITAANTNVAGVSVAEFNIADDHQGDIILDFSANCISGCGPAGDLMTQNSGNGAGSANSAEINQIINDNTFQQNDGNVINDLTLVSDSGNNNASLNTGGDSTIQTGDANVAANVLTFLNNNIAGNVILGMVNIFGNLVGDIILPQETIANLSNGTNSTNNANLTQTVNNSTVQTNDALIENNLDYLATTGSNEVNGNTDGDSAIRTGNADIESKTVNISNSNIDGGNWWLVFINESGEWIGKIIGAPDSSNFTGSEGTEFKVGDNGDITVMNSGNGADSENTSNVSQTVNNTLNQNNDANVTNNINLSANTGGNSANYNTGGSNTIQTGDAKVIANLVNFVNNNIKGNGKLIVTFVNVFGSWMGDFLTPGAVKPIASSSESNSSNSSDDKKAIGGASEVINDNSGGSFIEDNKPSEDSQDNGSDNGTSSNHNTDNTTSASALNTNIFIPQANTLVAGVSIELNEKFDSVKVQSANVENMAPKKIKVNLAWLLVAFPSFGLVYLLGKKFRIISELIQKGEF